MLMKEFFKLLLYLLGIGLLPWTLLEGSHHISGVALARVPQVAPIRVVGLLPRTLLGGCHHISRVALARAPQVAAVRVLVWLVLLGPPVRVVVVVVVAAVSLANALELLVFRAGLRSDEVAELLKAARMVLGELVILVAIEDAFAEGVNDVVIGELDARGLLSVF